MNIDATFWVAISFFIFIAGLIYLQIPQKVNNSLIDQISKIKNELEEAKKLTIEAKNLLSDYENKIDKSKKETQNIINLAKKNGEKNILEKTEKFHQLIEDRKKNIEQKITLMKENALKEIRNVSIKISLESVGHLIKNSIDKSKVEKFYSRSLEQIKTELKDTTKA
jgi:F-type H+-transporting ATPase subunit b